MLLDFCYITDLQKSPSNYITPGGNAIKNLKEVQICLKFHEDPFSNLWCS